MWDGGSNGKRQGKRIRRVYTGGKKVEGKKVIMRREVDERKEDGRRKENNDGGTEG